jgi:UDP-N-acetylmuramate--alanine ligase
VHSDADLRMSDIEPTAEGVGFRLLDGDRELTLGLRVPGRHNALNATAAYAAATCLGFPAEAVQRGLESFGGTRRRFEFKGEQDGVRVVDDYAHHPTEVSALLRAARPVAGEGRIIAVFQPHLFSRTRIFAEEFGVALGLADEVVVLEVYPAREDPEPGVTGALICDTVPLPGARVTFVPGREQGLERAATVVAARCRAGDLVLTIGAGDVTELGPMVLSRLRSAS